MKTLLADQRGYWAIANPTAILLSGVMMLDYLGETEAAQRIKQGIERVYREGSA